MTAIFIIDDDADLASSLTRMFRRHGYVAEGFSDPQQFLSAPGSVEKCCIVTDVMMGDMDGFELARQVRSRFPWAAIIFMTAWPRTQDAVEAVRDLGGLDYLEKPLDQDRLVEVVAQGLLWSAKRHEAAQRLSPLSPRERQIFDLLVRGRTNKIVAAQLNLSIKTVEDHRAAVMKKTGASSLAELIDLHL